MTLSRSTIRLASFFLAALCLALFSAKPSAAQDYLLFCNKPERMRMPGAYADSPLEAGKTYTIFYHFHNVSDDSGPFVVALHGMQEGPLRFTARQGFADPQEDPTAAGRQAMARYMSAPERGMVGQKGVARFAYPVQYWQTVSGILTVRCESAARLRIYFRHDQWDVPHAEVVKMEAPRREVEMYLSENDTEAYYRIGEPTATIKKNLDGAYGLMYRFRISAPEGWKVRVAFSPRGGKGGMVGSINGRLQQTRIVPATHWRVFCEEIVGADGVNVTTAPFGGAFYPVEMRFQLIKTSAKFEKDYWARAAAPLPRRKISSGSTAPVIVR